MDVGWSKHAGPRQPHPIEDHQDLRDFQDGYDVGLRYVDDHVGLLLQHLASMGIEEDTAIIITADHGEDMGEFAAYGSHCFCGPAVARVPMILRWPGKGSGVLHGLHQHFDIAATTLDLLDISPPSSWDAISFKGALESDLNQGRDVVVSSMLAQGIQRSAHWLEDDGLHSYVKTWENLAHPVPEELWIHPHHPPGDFSESGEGLSRGRSLLLAWERDMEKKSEHPDPLLTVLEDGTGPQAQMGDRYRQRVESTGRSWPQEP